MSISTLPVAMKRIKGARNGNHISVFIVTDVNGVRRLDTRFAETTGSVRMKAATVTTPRCKECGESVTRPVHEWIGDFCWANPTKDVRYFLQQALK